MKKFGEQALGYAVSGIFVFGAYSVGHYLLKANDSTIMVFALAMIWSDMATYVNKPDSKDAA
jgi:hypothetical protein